VGLDGAVVSGVFLSFIEFDQRLRTHVLEHGVCIRLSCNVLAKSVHTVLLVDGEEIETVVHEGAEELAIRENELQGRFDLGSDSRLVVRLKPSIAVRWTSLRTS
jgi:hypothetical protein